MASIHVAVVTRTIITVYYCQRRQWGGYLEEIKMQKLLRLADYVWNTLKFDIASLGIKHHSPVLIVPKDLN